MSYFEVQEHPPDLAFLDIYIEAEAMARKVIFVTNSIFFDVWCFGNFTQEVLNQARLERCLDLVF